MQAIADGEIIQIIPDFYPCSKGQSSAIYIYHPSIKKTVAYAELNKNSITKWKVGKNVKKGELLGKASACRMLHFEVYEGKRPNMARTNDASTWRAPIKGFGPTYRAETCLKVKPKRILDPTPFIKDILKDDAYTNLRRIQKAYEEQIAKERAAAKKNG